MRINLTKKDLVNLVYMQLGFSKQISENLIENVPNFESLIFPCFCKFSDIKKKNSSIKFSEICLEKPICM